MNRWRWATLIGLMLSVALLATAGGGALFVIVPAWLIGLAVRYDNHTGSLAFAAVLVAVVVLMLVGLIALAALPS